MKSVSGVIVALLLAAAAGSARAQDSAASQAPPVGVDTVLDAKVRSIAEQLRCPVCMGNSVAESPSALAADIKQLIREQLAAGKTEEQVKQYFVDRYGEWVLLNPQPHGFNLVVWLGPFVLLFAGGVGLTFAVRRWARTSMQSPGPAPAAPVEDEYLRRVREEVARGRHE